MKRLMVLLIPLALIAWPSAAGAAVTCSVLEIDPPGAAGNELFVRGSATEDQAAIVREGQFIQVSDDRTGSEVSCAGAAPTVHNIDSITFRAGAGGAGIFVSQAGGMFAPGATPEAGASSEIEITISAASGSTPGNIGIGGTAKSDSIRLGDLDNRRGANLNARENPDDVDLVFDTRIVSVLVRGGAGNDVITGEGGGAFGFSNLLGASLSVYGGADPDVIVGGRGPDILSGRAGDDLLRGGNAGDELEGGSGEDIFSGQAGGDRILSVDNGFDQVNCGAGKDGGRADRGDGLLACENVLRR